jgi:hypothetical protein
MKGICFILSALLTVLGGVLLGFAPVDGYSDLRIKVGAFAPEIPSETRQAESTSDVASPTETVVQLSLKEAAKPESDRPAAETSDYDSMAFFEKYGYQYEYDYDYDYETVESPPDDETDQDENVAIDTSEHRKSKRDSAPSWVKDPISGTIRSKIEDKSPDGESYVEADESPDEPDHENYEVEYDAWYENYEDPARIEQYKEESTVPTSTEKDEDSSGTDDTNQTFSYPTHENRPYHYEHEYGYDKDNFYQANIEDSSVHSQQTNENSLIDKPITQDPNPAVGNFIATDEYGDEMLLGPQNSKRYCLPYRSPYAKLLMEKISTEKEYPTLPEGQYDARSYIVEEPQETDSKASTDAAEEVDQIDTNIEALPTDLDEQDDPVDTTNRSLMQYLHSEGILDYPFPESGLSESIAVSCEKFNLPLQSILVEPAKAFGNSAVIEQADFYEGYIKSYPEKSEILFDQGSTLPKESNDTVPCRYRLAENRSAADVRPDKIEQYVPNPGERLTIRDCELLKRLDRMALDPPAIRRAVLKNYIASLGDDAYEIQQRFESSTGTSLFSLVEDIPSTAVFLTALRLVDDSWLLPSEASDLIQSGLANLSTSWAKQVARIAADHRDESIDLVIDRVYRQLYWQDQAEPSPIFQASRNREENSK